MYQPEADKNKDRLPNDSTPVWIGGRQTWVPRCTWDGASGRCYRSARLDSFCSWHSHCLDTGQRADDLIPFSKWFSSQGWDGWEVLEAFTAVTGEADPFYELRQNFGLGRYNKETQNPEHAKVNREFLKGLSVWMSKDKEAGQKRMEELAEAYPEHAAAFLLAGRQINPEEVKT